MEHIFAGIGVIVVVTVVVGAVVLAFLRGLKPGDVP